MVLPLHQIHHLLLEQPDVGLLHSQHLHDNRIHVDVRSRTINFTFRFVDIVVAVVVAIVVIGVVVIGVVVFNVP